MFEDAPGLEGREKRSKSPLRLIQIKFGTIRDFLIGNVEKPRTSAAIEQLEND